MDTDQKLRALADASRFDLACACGTKGNDDHRRRGRGGVWLYPVSLPDGGTSILLKTLLSNACVNDCRYCPFRRDRDVRRCTLQPEETADLFMDFVRRLGIHGLFLSSGVVRDADHTMDRMIAVAEILRRRHEYRGFIHLKVIPGASDAAIERAVSLANAVSLNVEVPTRSAFRTLSTTKDFDRDIVRPMKRISALTARGGCHARVKQTTQFIIGAAAETDAEIVEAASRLYNRLHLSRVYFSAYQRGLGDPALPGEQGAPGTDGMWPSRPRLGGVTGGGACATRMPGVSPAEDLLTREHRLYQVDWLLRKYGFTADEIPFEPNGRLSLTRDPKEEWARRHPEFFPVDLNRADRQTLLRVPGIGEITAKRILDIRHDGRKIRAVQDLGKPGKRLRKAEQYVTFSR